VVVCPVDTTCCDKGINRLFLSGGVPQDFSTFADALIRLNMRTGGYLLQEDLDWLCAGFTFEGQETGWFGWHGTEQ
jgi:hypothetical protein